LDLRTECKQCVIEDTARTESFEIKDCVRTETSHEKLWWLAVFWFEEKEQ